MKKKILFISPANLTTNPRLLKELRYAVELGYEVDFVGFSLGNWSDKIDDQIRTKVKANFKYISATRKPFFNWFLSTLFEKIYKSIFPLFKQNYRVVAFANAKRSILLDKYLRKNKKSYDLIVSHVLATLYPAYKFASRTNTKLVFDIEDYHPGEANTDAEGLIRETLMKQIVPKVDYVTYASPMIGEYSLKLCDNKIKNHQLINNCFSQAEFRHKDNNSEKLKFVWFSQNIASGRGLELVLPALEKFKNQVELHLIGNLYEDFYNDFLSDYSDILKIHKPLSQRELNLKLSEFDIGLAIEPGKDLNNKIAVSNKIWAYMQSGLYVLATDTPAQIRFLEEHQTCGIITGQETDNFKNSIKKIINNISEIRNNKKNRFDYAKQFSWENEQRKLDFLWSSILQK